MCSEANCLSSAAVNKTCTSHGGLGRVGQWSVALVSDRRNNRGSCHSIPREGIPERAIAQIVNMSGNIQIGGEDRKQKVELDPEPAHLTSQLLCQICNKAQILKTVQYTKLGSDNDPTGKDQSRSSTSTKRSMCQRCCKGKFQQPNPFT